MNIVRRALQIATIAHRGQYRNDNKTPYITHPIAVADKFKGKEAYYNDYFGINSQDLEAIALLHDVIEDTPADALTLIKQKIPCSLVDVIVTLTRLKHQDYLSYLLKVKDNLMAKFVKIEDIKHNLSTLDSKNKTMRDKYLLALYILEH